MSKQPPPAPTASAIGPCPTISQIVGRPGTGSLPRTIAPPDHPTPVYVRLSKVFFGKFHKISMFGRKRISQQQKSREFVF